MQTSGMPRLTLADALHNLPYSLDEHDWRRDLAVSELGSLVPNYGIVSLTDGFL